MKTIFLLAAALGLAATTALAADDNKPTSKKSCFSTRDWRGWSTSNDGDTLYLKVGFNDVYQIDLTPGSNIQKQGDRFLVSRVRGSDFVCSPIDLDLTLSDHNGFKEPIFVKALHKLTPDEIAAIPKANRP